MESQDAESSINVSFAGCGFLGVYHIGVASALREYAPSLVVEKIAGASAGAIAACSLICNMCLGQATSDVLKIAIQARQKSLGPLHPSFDLMHILRQGLRRNLPNDAHKIASGRLFVSLTRFSDGKNVLISQFDSKEELIQALICSAFIPLYCGAVPPLFRGVRYIDGGWSDNLPCLNENTVTVSPFSGESDICPLDADSQSFLSFDLKNSNIRFTSRNIFRFSVALFPPHPEVLSQMCREGFEDALRFLARHDLISCARCLEIKSSLVLAGFETRASNVAEVKTIPDDDQTPESTSKCTHNKLTSVKSLSRLIDPSVDTPCQSCKATRHVASRKGLPQAVRRSLGEAEANERTLIKYLFGMRVFKWLRIMILPWILPMDIALATFKKFLAWIPSIPEDGLWFLSKAIDAFNFVMKEMEEQRRRSNNRLTCRMAITDLNYSGIESTGVSLVGENNGATDPARHRRQSITLPIAPSKLSSVGGVPAPHTGQCTMTELSFGFCVDMPVSEAVNHMSDIVSREDIRKRGFDAADVSNAAENLELEGLRQASSVNVERRGSSPSPISLDPSQENFDTYAGILDFTHKRDAIMAYYYMDEHNHVKVTKIFGCEPKVSLSDSNNEPSACSIKNDSKSINLGAEKSNKQQSVAAVGPEKAVAVVAPFHQKTGAVSSKRLTFSGTNNLLKRNLKLKLFGARGAAEPSTSNVTSSSESDLEGKKSSSHEKRRPRRHTCHISSAEKAYEAEGSSEND